MSLQTSQLALRGIVDHATIETVDAFEKLFDRPGDFAALAEAETFLAERGFTYGPLQGAAPIGVMLGDVHVPKWRHMDAEMREWLHGRLDSDNWRAGPVTLRIRKSAPQAVIDAFVDAVAQAVVEGRAS